MRRSTGRSFLVASLSCSVSRWLSGACSARLPLRVRRCTAREPSCLAPLAAPATSEKKGSSENRSEARKRTSPRADGNDNSAVKGGRGVFEEAVVFSSFRVCFSPLEAGKGKCSSPVKALCHRGAVLSAAVGAKREAPRCFNLCFRASKFKSIIVINYKTLFYILRLIYYYLYIFLKLLFSHTLINPPTVDRLV